MRRLTQEERQVLLEHPELVMFNVNTEKETGIKTIAVFFIPALITISCAVALAFSPLGEAHPRLAVGLSVVLMILIICAFVPIFIYSDKRRYEKEQDNYNIRLLRRKLPEELYCKVVTIKYIVPQQAEGAYVENGKEKLFGYIGYKNIFPLLPDTDVAIVTDNKEFWAFIKRDDVTESLYKTMAGDRDAETSDILQV